MSQMSKFQVLKDPQIEAVLTRLYIFSQEKTLILMKLILS